MGNIASIGLSAGVNAISVFRWFSFLFNQLSDHGAEERKRHDLASSIYNKLEINGILKDRKGFDFIK